MEKYTEIYLKHYKSIYARCYMVLKDAHEAEDVVQEVFMATYKQWENLKDIDNLYAWLARLARNKCVDIIRKRVRHTLCEEVFFEKANYVSETELLSDTIEAAKQLPKKQKEIFDLIFIKGYHNKEVSELLHLPMSTVKGRLQMCTKELRRILQIQ